MVDSYRLAREGSSELAPTSFVSEYEPTWRDKLAQMILGERPNNPYRRGLAEMLVGSAGGGQTSTAPLTPGDMMIAGTLAAAPIGRAARVMPGETFGAAARSSLPAETRIQYMAPPVKGARGADARTHKILYERAKDEADRLPMDPVMRLQRAKEIGFDDRVMWYHGTAAPDINAFDRARGGSNIGQGSPGELGIFLSADPEVASGFAQSATPFLPGRAPNVMPVRFRLPEERRKIASFDLKGAWDQDSVYATIKQAWDDGYEAVLMRNYKDPRTEKLATNIVVRDPSRLRSPFAQFDPRRKFDNNLMAGLGASGGIAGAVALQDKSLGDILRDAQQRGQGPQQ